MKRRKKDGPALSEPRRRRVEGFTLIELLLVVVIIGILAAIVVPKLTGKSQDAQVGAAKAQIKTFQTALSMFEIDNGKYPTTDMKLDSLIVKPSVTPELPKWKKLLETNSIPLDPWGKEYVYKCPGEKNPDGYDLYSLGPDGQEGTEDDIEKP